MEDVHLIYLGEIYQSTLPCLLHTINNAREVLRLGLDHRSSDALLIEGVATVLQIFLQCSFVINNEFTIANEPFSVEEPLQ